MADGLLGIWREPIEPKGLRLIYEPGNPLDTRYNATLLHAVMGNLLRNALHYTEHGFIRLDAGADWVRGGRQWSGHPRR